MEMFARMTAEVDVIPQTLAPAPAAAAPATLTTITQQTRISQTQNIKWKWDREFYIFIGDWGNYFYLEPSMHLMNQASTRHMTVRMKTSTSMPDR